MLEVKPQKRRISLGLKQALGDPWLRIGKEHPVNTAVIGTVRKIVSYGAFVEIIEGVDGLLHISDITSERRLNSPSEMLKEGQRVRVRILSIDTAKKRVRVGMKQLEPTEADRFMSEVEIGSRVTGRVKSVQDGTAVIELGTGVHGICSTRGPGSGNPRGTPLGQTSDLSSLKTMLESAWAGRERTSSASSRDPLAPGSVHSFTVKRMDAETGAIELSRA